MSRRRARRPGLALAAALLVGACRVLAAPAPQPERVFGGEERVTAIDLAVEVGRPGKDGALSSGGKLPHLEAGDLELRFAGESRPLVGLGLPPSGKAGGEPWILVLYFDRTLAGPRAVRWAARALGDQATELTARGAVEIWVADPDPVQVLAPTRDRDRVSTALARLELLSGEEEGDLVAVRQQFLDEMEDLADAEDAEATPAGLARAAFDDELRRVETALDALLLTLVDDVKGKVPRALVLVSSGYDLAPGSFYLPFAGQSPAAAPTLEPATVGISRALAAYGWTVFPLRPPDPEPRHLVHGLRLGKWLFRFDSGGFLNGLGIRAVYEEHRDPERAEAYVQLGLAHEAAGEAEAAIDAYQKALYHFADAPRTARREAFVLLHLAPLLEAQGRWLEGRLAVAGAVEIDPAAAAEHPGAGTLLHEPREPLRRLAEASAGALVEDDEALGEALSSLDRRVRLTYQLSGPASGEVGPVEVRTPRSDLALRFPLWGRSGVPAAVPGARARRLLAGELPRGGQLAVPARLDRRRGMLVLVAQPAAPEGSAGPPPALRLSLAVGEPGGRAGVRHLPLAPTPDGRWEVPVDLPSGDAWLAVVVDDPETGRWGARVLETGGER